MSLVCVGFLMFATAPAAEANGHPFAGGNGTEGDPYQIETLDQLRAVDNYLTSHFVLNNDINAADTATWNWSVAEGVYKGFDPIGNWNPPFTGHFNGNGKVITDLHIHRPGEKYVGLFGYVGTGGTIIDVGVVGGSITGQYYVGGLVGMNTGTGTITNSYATGNVSGTGNHVGGLVGAAWSGTITDSYATGTVEGQDRIGGLVGANGGSITNSYATGTVSGTTNVGGLVGQEGGIDTIENSYATGDVSGTTNVGGLVGANFGTITNSYATGAVTGTSNVGGLVGRNWEGTITTSFWDKDTTGWSSSAGGTGKTTAEMQQRSTFTTAGWDYGTVWQQVYVTGVTLDQTTLNLTVGATGNLIATVEPTAKEITYPYLQWQGTTNLPVVATGKNVEWSSSNSSVASVVYTYGETTATVTAKAVGTATITVTTVCGSETDICTVTVTAAGGTPGGGGGGGRDDDDDPAPDKEEIYGNVSDGIKEQLEDAEAGAELQIEVGAEDLPPALDYETVQGLVENQNNLNVAFEEAKVDLHFTPEALWTDELQAAGVGTLVGLSAAILEGEDAQAAANFAVGIGGEVLRAYDLGVTVVADTGDEEGTKVHQLNGAVTVTLDLSDLDLTAVNTEQLTIQHQQPDGTWLELKSTFDPETKTLTFTTDRFSMFAVVEKPAAPGTITLTIGQTAADVYGTPYVLDAVPYIQAGTGRTMIPLRFVSEALGAEVDWQAEARQVLIKDGATEIVLTIDSDRVLVNGTPATLDCRAELKPPGRTFVPLRFISETLGAQVDYDEETKRITITRH